MVKADKEDTNHKQHQDLLVKKHASYSGDSQIFSEVRMVVGYEPRTFKKVSEFNDSAPVAVPAQEEVMRRFASNFKTFTVSKGHQTK